MIVANNLVANTTCLVITTQLTTGRYQNGRQLTLTKNPVLINTFINAGAPLECGDKNHVSDHNVYINMREPNHIDLEDLRETGLDQYSQALSAYAEFNTKAPSFF